MPAGRVFTLDNAQAAGLVRWLTVVIPLAGLIKLHFCNKSTIALQQVLLTLMLIDAVYRVHLGSFSAIVLVAIASIWLAYWFFSERVHNNYKYWAASGSNSSDNVKIE